MRDARLLEAARYSRVLGTACSIQNAPAPNKSLAEEEAKESDPHSSSVERASSPAATQPLAAPPRTLPELDLRFPPPPRGLAQLPCLLLASAHPFLNTWMENVSTSCRLSIRAVQMVCFWKRCVRCWPSRHEKRSSALREKVLPSSLASLLLS